MGGALTNEHLAADHALTLPGHLTGDKRVELDSGHAVIIYPPPVYANWWNRRSSFDSLDSAT